MSNKKLYALKGDFSYRVAGTQTSYKPFLNATEGSISMTIETIKQKSNGNTPGTYAEDEASREATFSVTIQDRHKENLKKLLYANSVEVPASVEPVAFTLPACEPGDIFKLPAANVTDATFGALVAGVDYRLLPRTGSGEALKKFVATPGTFSHGAYTKYGIFSADSIELEILFTSERSGQSYVLYRLRLSPAATFQLVSDSAEFGSSQLTGTLLLEPSAPVDENLGQLGRAESID